MGCKTWNDGEWGNLADETVTLTGVSTTSSVGSLTLTGTAVIVPSGVSATFNVGSITLPVITCNASLPSLSFSGNVGSFTNVIDVAVVPTKCIYK